MEHKQERIDELNDLMNQPGFWDDQERSMTVSQEMASLKDDIQQFESLWKEWEDLQVLREMAEEEDDDAVRAEVAEGTDDLADRLEEWDLKLLLSEEYDENGAFLSIHSGAGGTEAQDWVEMLYRMYSRWMDKNGYKIEVTDVLPGDEAGIKSITLRVSGRYAYGYLKAEKGVHRLVRISPFDASGRRHTSFASVDVIPEIDDNCEVEINPEDIKMETCRASGAGGQHINKTDSAVRLIHIPTGIIVQCQNERSQYNNRALAMKILQAKLFALEQEKQREKLSEIRGQQQEIAWGSQIRSYVFHPYNMVKDHRTNWETGNTQAVMDGDLNPFIAAYLRYNLKK